MLAKCLAAAAALLACLVTSALLVQPAGGADVTTRIVPVRADPPGSPLTLRPLTARQRRHVKRVIARDSRLRRIVQPHSYKLAKLVPLGVEDKRPGREREVFVGARVDAPLDGVKALVDGERWPLADFPANLKRPAYRIRTAKLTVRGLSALTLYVDLKRRKVAGIFPEQATEVVYPPSLAQPRPPTGA